MERAAEGRQRGANATRRLKGPHAVAALCMRSHAATPVVCIAWRAEGCGAYNSARIDSGMRTKHQAGRGGGACHMLLHVLQGTRTLTPCGPAWGL
jgi:hypothetical protein